jgi:predicted DNA-binding transcriptional regulator AlpA
MSLLRALSESVWLSIHCAPLQKPNAQVPRPIKIGDRTLGWRIGDLADGLAQRSSSANAFSPSKKSGTLERAGFQLSQNGCIHEL